MTIQFRFLVIALLISGTPAVAAPKKGNMGGLSALGTLKGTCMLLTIMGKDATTSCSGVLANTVYRDGRSGFYFVTDDGAAITFSGMGSRQIKQGPDTAIQPIDLLIFSYKGHTDKTLGVGTCKFSNPNNGPVPVFCTVETKAGKFEGTFMTDGRPPEFMHF